MNGVNIDALIKDGIASKYFVFKVISESNPIRVELVDNPDVVSVVRCKDCKYYELDSWANVNGIPLIVAHQICKRWGNGCKTDENGFCFMGEELTE